MPNLKRRATAAPDDTVLHPSKYHRLMCPMKEITNVPPTRDSICNGEVPQDTMTMRQIRRHIEWLINTAETAGKLGNKKAVKARLAEFIAFDEILPTRSFEELQEEWHGQCQAMVDEVKHTSGSRRCSAQSTVRQLQLADRNTSIAYADQI
jgi:hypothetical protein